jgi:hypothetical protein
MNKLAANRDMTHLRWRSAHLSVRLTKQRFQGAEGVIEASRTLLDRPVYPYDPNGPEA